MGANPLRLILLHMKTRHGLGSTFYTDSARIADSTGLESKVVGQRLRYMAESESVPFELTEWSRTAGCITYRVTTPTGSAYHTYLQRISKSEPSFAVSD